MLLDIEMPRMDGYELARTCEANAGTERYTDHHDHHVLATSTAAAAP